MRNYDGRMRFRDLALMSASLLVLVLAVGAGGCIGPPAPPRGRIEGTVVDAISGAPIVGASIVVDNRVLGPADLTGRFAVNRLTVGQHVVSVSRYGYLADQHTVSVQAGRVTICEIQLTPALPGTSSIYGHATLATTMLRRRRRSRGYSQGRQPTSQTSPFQKRRPTPSRLS